MFYVVSLFTSFIITLGHITLYQAYEDGDMDVVE